MARRRCSWTLLCSAIPPRAYKHGASYSDGRKQREQQLVGIARCRCRCRSEDETLLQRGARLELILASRPQPPRAVLACGAGLLSWSLTLEPGAPSQHGQHGRATPATVPNLDQPLLHPGTLFRLSPQQHHTQTQPPKTQLLIMKTSAIDVQLPVTTIHAASLVELRFQNHRHISIVCDLGRRRLQTC